MPAEQTKFFFRLPNDRNGRLNYDSIASILYSIPSTWSYLSGWLIYPNERMQTPLSEAPVIANRTMQCMWRNLAPTYRGVAFKDGTDELATHSPYHPEMAIYRPNGPWPRAVEFCEAGFGSTPEYAHYSFKSAIDLAAHYVRECRYIGWLRCALQAGQYDGETAATIRLRMTPGEGQEEPGVCHPPRLWIEFNPRWGGKLDDIEPVLAACRKLRLAEYILGSNIVDAY